MADSKRIQSDEIRRLIAGMAWTQTNLADAAGLSRRAIEDMLTKGTTSAASLRRVATALGVEVTSLLLPAAAESPRPVVTPKLFRLATNSDFCFGRSAELTALDQAWGDARTNVVVLVADGGYGKTTLVARWLRELSDRNYLGAGGVYGYSFSAQGVDSPHGSETDFLNQSLTEWFHEPPPPETAPEARGQRLAELVRVGRALLLLDGLETLQRPDGCGRYGLPVGSGVRKLLEDLALPSEEPCLCVVTTRSRVSELALWVGKTVRVIDLGPLDDEAGVRLLAELRVTGAPIDLRAAVREWRGHPLNLTWLGTQLQLYGGDVRERAAVTGAAPDYRTDLLFESAERGLGDRENAFLRVLAFFDEPAAWPEIMALIRRPAIPGLTEPLQDLGELDWSGLLRTLEKRRLVAVAPSLDGEESVDFFHPIARGYYRAIIRSTDVWVGGNDRLFRYYRGDPAELVEDEVDFARLHRAVAHGCAAGAYREAFEDVIWNQFCRGLAGYKAHRFGLGPDDVQTVRLFFPHPDNPDPVARIGSTFGVAELGCLHHWAGVVAHSTSGLAEAILRNTNAAALFRQAGDARGELFANGYLARHHMLAGHLSTAIKYAADCRGLIREHFPSERPTSMVLLGVEAMNFHAAGNWADAEQTFDRLWSIAESGAKEFAEILALTRAYYCEYLLDRHEWLGEALDRGKIDRMADEIPSVGLPRLLAEVARGRCHLLAGDSARAADCLERAVGKLAKVRNTEFVVAGYLGRARLNRVRGDLIRARADVTDALRRATTDRFRLCEVDCRLEMGAVCLAAGERSEAHGELEKTAHFIAACGYHRAKPKLNRLNECFTCKR